MNIWGRIFCFVLLAFGSSELQASGFIKLQGIRGNSTDKNHIGWSDISAIRTYGPKEDGIVGVWKGEDPPTRPDGTPTKPFSFTKGIDSISPLIASRVAEKSRMKTVKVDFEMPDGRLLYLVLWEVTFGSVKKISESEEEITLYYEAAQAYNAKIRE